MEMDMDNMELLKAIKERTNAFQAKIKAMRGKRDAHKEKMDANMNAWREKSMTCQETTEAYLKCKEPTTKELQSEAKNCEVPKEEAAVKYSGA